MPKGKNTVEQLSAKRSGSKRTSRGASYVKPDNDNISVLFEKNNLIPKDCRGTDKFLDVVNWNIRFFNNQDPERVDTIVEVLSQLNADVIVLVEILDGSLEVVAQKLAERKLGYYQIAYGTTGGNQRVAIMWDLDWVRAKDDITEIFEKGEVVTGEGKDVFPRLPLHGYFTSLTRNTGEEPFDFQLLGVHLKSQRGGGGDQRRMAAERLAKWLSDEAPKQDADVIILGDWNEPPSAATWAPFHKLEDEGRAAFRQVNDDSNISHLMYRNRSEIGSRLDLATISAAALPDMKAPPKVATWRPLTSILNSGKEAQDLKTFISKISNDISDHMPVVTRFYFTAKN